MKNYWIIYLVFFVFYSCNNISQKDEIELDESLGHYLEDVLKGSYDEIEFFEDSCLSYVEKGFKHANVWDNDYYLWEGCVFKPKKELIIDASKDLMHYDFLAYFIENEKDSNLIYEIYARDLNFDGHLKPVHFKQGNFIIDSLFTVTLYLGGGIQCGSLFLKGTDYSDTSKLGIYEKIESPELKGYVDSVLKVRNFTD